MLCLLFIRIIISSIMIIFTVLVDLIIIVTINSVILIALIIITINCHQYCEYCFQHCYCQYCHYHCRVYYDVWRKSEEKACEPWFTFEGFFCVLIYCIAPHP